MNDNIFDPNLPAEELAFRILRREGRPLYYKDLIIQALRLKGVEGDISPELMAAVLTQINLDNRFIHMGQNDWGLKDWAPRKTKEEEKESEGGKRAFRKVNPLPRFDEDLEEEEEEDDLDYDEEHEYHEDEEEPDDLGDEEEDFVDDDYEE